MDNDSNQPTDRGRECALWQGQPSQWENFWPFFWGVMLCFLVVPVIYATYRRMKTDRTFIVLTNQRLRFEWGILSKHLSEIELFRIKDTAWSASFVERMVGLGRVEIISSDRSSRRATIAFVRDSYRLREVIRELAEAQRALHRVREVDMIVG